MQAWLSAVVFVLGLAAPAAAHEFWLEMVDFRPKVGASVPVLFRNGQNFVGDSYPYLRKLAKRLALIDAKGDRPIKAIEGDDPVAEIKFTQSGLAIVAYQSNAESVTFDTFERFVDNLKEEGLEAIAALHEQQGKPKSGIRELFSRNAKALVDVGAGGGNDRAVGQPLEIVAAANPYRLADGAPLVVQVLFNGQPLPDVLVKTFHLKDAQSPRRQRTDANGRVTIELPLAGEYLINAAHMIAAGPKENAHWSSLWASLTFDRPKPK